jgi:beta-glucanase (GH16 family)
MRNVGSAGSRWAVTGAIALAFGCGLAPPEQPKSAPTPAPTPAAQPVSLPPAGYQLVWEDDFQGTTLNSSKWTALTGPRRDAFMVADAASVSGGVLNMTTYTQDGQHHTAFLTTDGNFMPTFGYVEARILFQDAPGEWCAFWLESPTNGVPLGDPAHAGVEIDVVEHRATDQGGWTALANMVALNLNWDGYGSNERNAQKVALLPDGSPVQGAWHTYGVLWTETGYIFYVDGLQLWTTSAAVSLRSESIRLTCEVQDRTWAGTVPTGGYGSRDASTTGMRVDWVRVWQKG